KDVGLSTPQLGFKSRWEHVNKSKDEAAGPLLKPENLPFDANIYGNRRNKNSESHHANKRV
ncbi:MAG: hypothetical protein KGI00_05115, partial [Candidatus Micrarchaeota archaeon]|nr:hypothetical protein [Candidatus Micrarchaeota archaeon]